jgi:hypothetical protein
MKKIFNCLKYKKAPAWRRRERGEITGALSN